MKFIELDLGEFISLVSRIFNYFDEELWGEVKFSNIEILAHKFAASNLRGGN